MSLKMRLCKICFKSGRNRNYCTVQNQVEALSKEITDIDAAVHKFQGKEKENIIISTVDDEISDFADDPYLINVAVSRAKKEIDVGCNWK